MVQRTRSLGRRRHSKHFHRNRNGINDKLNLTRQKWENGFSFITDFDWTIVKNKNTCYVNLAYSWISLKKEQDMQLLPQQISFLRQSVDNSLNDLPNGHTIKSIMHENNEILYVDNIHIMNQQVCDILCSIFQKLSKFQDFVCDFFVQLDYLNISYSRMKSENYYFEVIFWHLLSYFWSDVSIYKGCFLSALGCFFQINHIKIEILMRCFFSCERLFHAI